VLHRAILTHNFGSDASAIMDDAGHNQAKIMNTNNLPLWLPDNGREVAGHLDLLVDVLPRLLRELFDGLMQYRTHPCADFESCRPMWSVRPLLIPQPVDQGTFLFQDPAHYHI